MDRLKGLLELYPVEIRKNVVKHKFSKGINGNNDYTISPNIYQNKDASYDIALYLCEIRGRNSYLIAMLEVS